MATKISADTVDSAIFTNLLVLHELLLNAALRVGEARQWLEQEGRKSAIGSMLGVDASLDEAKHLYGTVLVLHRKASQ